VGAGGPELAQLLIGGRGPVGVGPTRPIVEKRPTMTFRSVRISGAGSFWQVDGELTIGDITQPQVLAVELGGIETILSGPRHAGFEATTEVRRKEFGIDVAMPPGVSAPCWATWSRSISTSSSSEVCRVVGVPRRQRDKERAAPT
jgi:hypothetical protein